MYIEAKAFKPNFTCRIWHKHISATNYNAFIILLNYWVEQNSIRKHHNSRQLIKLRSKVSMKNTQHTHRVKHSGNVIN